MLKLRVFSVEFVFNSSQAWKKQLIDFITTENFLIGLRLTGSELIARVLCSPVLTNSKAAVSG
jgi:hypothetical protein